MSESDKIIKRIEKSFRTANLNAVSLVKKALDDNVDAKLICKAISDGFEKAERSALGDLVFKGDHKAWGNYITLIIYFMANEALKLLKPHLKPHLGKRIVIGMAKNEVHNIGKNIVSTLLEIAGFEVFDLGIDVPPEKFIEKVKEVNADVLGISSLYPNGFNNLKRTINLLEKEGLKAKVKVIIGGSMIKDMAEEWGADIYGQCASLSINTLKKILKIEDIPLDRLGGGIINW